MSVPQGASGAAAALQTPIGAPLPSFPLQIALSMHSSPVGSLQLSPASAQDQGWQVLPLPLGFWMQVSPSSGLHSIPFAQASPPKFQGQVRRV